MGGGEGDRLGVSFRAVHTGLLSEVISAETDIRPDGLAEMEGERSKRVHPVHTLGVPNASNDKPCVCVTRSDPNVETTLPQL